MSKDLKDLMLTKYQDALLESPQHPRMKYTKKSGASPFSTVVAIVKNVVGSGLLTLPKTFYSATPEIGFAVMLSLAVTNAISFWVLGILSEGQCSSYTQLWERCVGRSSRVLPILCVALNGTITCASYAVVIGQQLPLAFGDFLKALFEVPDSQMKLAVLTPCVFFCILPLALLSSLETLKYPSIMGLAFTACSILIVITDSIKFGFFGKYLDSSDKNISAYEAQTGKGNFEKHDADLSGILGTVSLYSAAFACHYNSPRWYMELEHESQNPRSFAAITFAAFFIVVLIFGSFSFFGYARFGPFLSDNILKDYGLVQPESLLGGDQTIICFAWVGIAFSVLTSFPLAFNSARQAYFEAFEAFGLSRFGFRGNIDEAGNKAYISFTVIFCILALIAGVEIDDLGRPNKIKGFTTTNALCGLLPGVMLYKKMSEESSIRKERKRKENGNASPSENSIRYIHEWREGDSDISEEDYLITREYDPVFDMEVDYFEEKPMWSRYRRTFKALAWGIMVLGSAFSGVGACVFFNGSADISPLVYGKIDPAHLLFWRKIGENPNLAKTADIGVTTQSFSSMENEVTLSALLFKGYFKGACEKDIVDEELKKLFCPLVKMIREDKKRETAKNTYKNIWGSWYTENEQVKTEVNSR